MQTNLYDNQIYFGIIFNDKTTFIIEPQAWAEIQGRQPRDPTYHGFWSDFLEDKYGMMFSYISQGGLTGGGTLLKEIFNTPGQGSKAIVYFVFGEMIYNTPNEVNRWRINMNEFSDDVAGAYATIEKMPFQGKLRARMSAPCTINNYSNMDGQELTPISTWQARLHSKTLQLTSKSISPTLQQSNVYKDNFGTGNPLVMQPDQSNLVLNELPEVFSQPVALINIGSVSPSTPEPTDIYDKVLCQYTVRFGGLLNVNVAASFNWWYWHRGFEYAPAGGATGWTVQSELVVQRLVGGILTNVTVISGPVVGIDSTSPGHVWPATAPTGVLPDVAGADRTTCNMTPLTWNETYTDVVVEANDNVYVHLILQPAGIVSDLILITVQADNFIGSIEYTQLTTTPGTIAPGYRIFDFLNQQLENITGQKNSLISNFFSPGGFGYKYLLMNGYSIRNYGANIYMPKKDFVSTVNDLQAMFCLGAGVKKINGVEYFVLDSINEFYKDRTIARFTETFDWKNTNNPNVCFNKAELGYDKFEGLNIIQQDEFNTEGSYLLQTVEYNDNTLRKKCGMISAGYIIEEQRRHQYDQNPGQKLTNDDDIFIIAVTDNPLKWVIPTVQFVTGLSRIYFNVNSMAMQPGDTFVITSSTGGSGFNIGTVFTVTALVSGYPAIGVDAYTVSPFPINDITFNNAVEITPPTPLELFAERSFPFAKCSGVIDPSTIYNGRLSLKHILYNWRPVLGVGLTFEDPSASVFDSAQIVTTLVKMNSLASFQFLSTEPHKGNIGNLTTVENTNEFVRDYLREGSNIYGPVSVPEVKVKMGYNEYTTMRKALAGELGDDTKDNGGAIFRDYEGVDWFCQITDFKYSFVTQIATFKVQKSYKVTTFTP